MDPLAGDADVNGMRAQVLLIGLGSVLYITPYLFGSQMTMLTGNITDQLMPVLVSSRNPDLALALCYLSAAAIGVLGAVAVAYNFRLSMTRRPRAA